MLLFRDKPHDNQNPLKCTRRSCHALILGGTRNLDRKDKALLLLLALEFVPAKHTIVTIPESLQENIVQARHRFIQEVVGVELGTCSDPTER